MDKTMKEDRLILFISILIFLALLYAIVFGGELPYSEIHLQEPNAELQINRNFQRLEELIRIIGLNRYT